jgi:cell division septation protein DedD
MLQHSGHSESTYFVQLGAFANPTHAYNLALQASRAGYRASVAKAVTQGGRIVFRVRIDHALDRNSVEMVVATLKQKISGAQPFVVREEP